MVVTKEYLEAQRQRLMQQRVELHNQVVAFGGAIEMVDAILADLAKPAPEAEAKPEPAPSREV